MLVLASAGEGADRRMESTMADRDRNGSPPPPGTEDRKRILFVDDDELMVEMTARRLERMGYAVVAVTSGTEALKVFQQEPERFDLVITDYTMPDMNGADLARSLVEIRPDIPIVVCTGLDERARPVGLETEVKAFCAKVLTKTELGELVEGVIGKA